MEESTDQFTEVNREITDASAQRSNRRGGAGVVYPNAKGRVTQDLARLRPVSQVSFN